MSAIPKDPGPLAILTLAQIWHDRPADALATAAAAGAANDAAILKRRESTNAANANL